MSNRKLIKSLVNEEGAKLVNRESILEEVLIVFEISSACPLGDSWRLEGGVGCSSVSKEGANWLQTLL